MKRLARIATLLIVTLSLSAAASASGEQRKKATTSRKPRPAASGEARPHEHDAVGALMDQILMLRFGNAGNTEAHLFLEDIARYGGGASTTAESRTWHIRGQYRKFKGPKNDGSIIVMFPDHSGVYIHPDGFATPMGNDIRHEVVAWEELHN